MKNLPLIFCGVFASLAFSWAGLILTGEVQVGGLQPYDGPAYKGGKPEGDKIHYPEASPKGGAAEAGKKEYIKLGCIYCHTQQVRPAELFPKGEGDIDARNYAPRHTVARDYITQDRVLLGTMRTGPDLANIGARSAADWHLLHFFDPTLTSPKSNMPPLRFLYTPVTLAPGEAVPAGAIKIEPADREKRGIPGDVHYVPTERARNLVAYLMSLKTDGSIPEAQIK